jgi:hypothetical protein
MQTAPHHQLDSAGVRNLAREAEGVRLIARLHLRIIAGLIATRKPRLFVQQCPRP